MRGSVDKIGKLPREVLLSSILVGLFADVRSINSVLVSFLPLSEEGIMSYIYMILLIMVAVLSIFYNRLIKISGSNAVIAVFLIIFYFLTVLTIGHPEVTILDFLVFTICAIMLPCFSQVNGKVLLRTMMFAPSIGIFRVNEIFALDDIVGNISMGLTYAFLPPVIATIVYLFTCFKYDSKKLKIAVLVGTIINSIFLLRMMFFGSRGPILAIIFTVAFLLLVKKDTSIGVMINKKMVLLTVALLIVLMASLENVLLLFDSILAKFDIDFRFIEKSLALISEDNLDHDRGDIAMMAWNGFCDSPIWGNGLDRFMANTGITYPHNFILQILYDGGMILFFVLLIPVIRGLWIKYKNCTLSSYMVLTTLFFSSVPGALLSGNMWRQALLWLLMGAALSKCFFYKNNDTVIK